MAIREEWLEIMHFSAVNEVKPELDELMIRIIRVRKEKIKLMELQIHDPNNVELGIFPLDLDNLMTVK